MKREALRHRPLLSARRQLLIFSGVAALAVIVLAFGAVTASRSVAQRAALRDAERMTNRMGNLVVGPLLAAALDGSTHRMADLDQAVQARMRDGYLVQVTVWSADGTVIYADDRAMIGRVFPAPDEVTQALTSGATSSDFATASEASDIDYGGSATRFVEVYTPMRTGEETLVFEAYYDYARVTEVADTLLWQIIPLALVPLILLQLIQTPIAWSLARRVRRQETERRYWLEQSLSMSEKERMRIAGDLHDGSIQDLAGISYALGAIAPGVSEADRPLMQTIQDAVLRANESLRRLMVEVYPPDLNAARLPQAITDLAVPLREHDLTVHVVVEQLPELPVDSVTTLYRVAREALLNVIEHARAANVHIDLSVRAQGSSPPDVVLLIQDDGVGVDPSDLDRRAQGHLGLRLLRDRLETLGGTLTIGVGAPAGTTVEAVLPLGAPSSGRRAHRRLSGVLTRQRASVG